MKVVLWFGPVETANIKRAVPAGWDIRTYNHGAGGGIGSDAFKAWALSLGPDALGKLAPMASEILLMGFSAAHGAIDVILQQAADARDERVRGLIACDAYYSAHNVTTPKPGYLAWCKWALEQGLPAWFTTSTHHPAQHPSASVSIAPLGAALELELQKAPPGMPPPVETRGRREILWMNYGGTLTHKQHATELAARMLEVGPFFGGARLKNDSPSIAQNDNQKPAPPPGPAPPAPPPSPPTNQPAPSNPALGGLLVLGGVGLGVWALARRR